MTHFSFQSVICHAHFYFLSMLQSLWGYQAEGLYFLGHWYVCCWPSGKYHEESAQSAPCVYTCPGRWEVFHFFFFFFSLAGKKMLYFLEMWQGQLVTIHFLAFYCIGHAWSEGGSLPEHPLCPGQQWLDRCHSHDAEAWGGEAAGEECWDPVGCTEGAHSVKSTTLNSPVVPKMTPDTIWFPPSFPLVSLIVTGWCYLWIS